MAASLVSRMPGLEERSWEDSVVENSVISWLSGDQLILARPSPPLVWSSLGSNYPFTLIQSCWLADAGLAWLGLVKSSLACCTFSLTEQVLSVNMLQNRLHHHHQLPVLSGPGSCVVCGPHRAPTMSPLLLFSSGLDWTGLDSTPLGPPRKY